jgi:hypothetical protein
MVFKPAQRLFQRSSASRLLPPTTEGLVRRCAGWAAYVVPLAAFGRSALVTAMLAIFPRVGGGFIEGVERRIQQKRRVGNERELFPPGLRNEIAGRRSGRLGNVRCVAIAPVERGARIRWCVVAVSFIRSNRVAIDLRWRSDSWDCRRIRAREEEEVRPR